MSVNADVPEIILVGIKGFLEGEHLILKLGESCVVGRSRKADISLKKARKFRERSDWPKLAKTERFLSVSRRHLRIHFLHPDLVEIEDLSKNGTLVDGRRVDRIGLTDVRTTPHEIRVGSMEKLRLEWHGNGQAGADGGDDPPTH
ncbi:MAG: FHA domain-containing protein [Planctomycetota bacterium]